MTTTMTVIGNDKLDDVHDYDGANQGVTMETVITKQGEIID